jgi:hypothetical protein
MIAGTFHQGSGLGNQLHRYVMTRSLAMDKGYEWGMLNPQNFKGHSFMDLWTGKEPLSNFVAEFNEKKIVENGVDIRGYDPEVNFVQDGTLIEGEFQDERYFEHRLPEIREWLKVQPLKMAENVCVINFRGGEYSLFPELFLTKEYWKEAVKLVTEKYPEIEFEVHTDDPHAAKLFFPDYMIVQDIGLNWRSIRYAKHLILSNSSFAILPALMNEDVKEIIAPRYWARRNTGVWALPQNYYKKFTYI